jgi:hypothetical protein
LSLLAEVLHALPAIATDTTGFCQPGYPNAITEPDVRDRPPLRDHAPNNFMTGRDRKVEVWQLSVQHVKIGATYPACEDFNEDLVLLRRGAR